MTKKILDYDLLFPWPPSVNTLYFQGPKHGQKFLSKKGKLYKQSLIGLYGDDERLPIEGPVGITLTLFPPDKRKRDIDNYVKPLLDGLTFLNILVDDSQVKFILVQDAPTSPKYNKGIVHVRVGEVEQNSTRTVSRLDLIEDLVTELNLDQEDLSHFHKPLKSKGKSK